VISSDETGLLLAERKYSRFAEEKRESTQGLAQHQRLNDAEDVKELPDLKF
jgi:hypothetical protein